ncbi:amino acid permease-domain-containing protein [Aspergillus recurvatus]
MSDAKESPDPSVGGKADLEPTFSLDVGEVIALGSNIGSGLFIGTGKALANGGPANMILAFFTVCIGVWAHLQTLAEMTNAFPTSEATSTMLTDGLAEWLDYWAEGVVPEAALLKVFLFVFFVIISLAIIGGARPAGSVKDGSTWTDLPAFKNGFGGFASAALLAVWAVGDQIYIGVLGGEAQSPRYSMAHAANVVPWRVAVFYMTLVTFVSVVVPSSDSRLLGSSGSAASLFVIAVDNAGIKGVPDLVNACMVIGIIPIALECIYLPSRKLRTMALQKLIPSFIADGTEVLNWFIAITSASFFINFAIVAFTSLRFRAAPLTPIIVLVVSALLLVCLLYSSMKPVNDISFTACIFYLNILGVLVILVPTALYKVILRTKWRDPKTADLVTGRRQLLTEDILLLDEHYSRPLWRRVGTYVRV